MSGYKITNSDGLILASNGKGLTIPTVDNIDNASTSVPAGTIIFNLADNNVYRFNGTLWLISAGTSGSDIYLDQKFAFQVSVELLKETEDGYLNISSRNIT